VGRKKIQEDNENSKAQKGRAQKDAPSQEAQKAVAASVSLARSDPFWRQQLHAI
jgi:hypothetical protein